MKPSSGHFKNTSGEKALSNQEKIDIVQSINEGKTNVIPDTISQIDHIFREGDGHISFSKENVKKLSNLINNDNNLVLEKDKYGNSWYAKTNPDGTQSWGTVYGGKLRNGGVNSSPKEVDPETGLSNNNFNN